jgi:hypothetical protein
MDLKTEIEKAAVALDQVELHTRVEAVGTHKVKLHKQRLQRNVSILRNYSEVLLSAPALSDPRGMSSPTRHRRINDTAEKIGFKLLLLLLLL